MASSVSPEKSPGSDISKQTVVSLDPPKPAKAEQGTDGTMDSKPKKRILTPRRIGLVLLLIAIGAVLGGVFGARENARIKARKNWYPVYSQIDYELMDTYEGAGFFDDFHYFDEEDPTHGFVNYTNATTATASNLTQVTTFTPPDSIHPNNGTAILRVDNITRNTTTGRRSVRITSKRTWSTGLFLFDVIHAPHGCATWPALWLSDIPAWPEHGEIDVFESVNAVTTGNHVTLHTSKGCRIGIDRRRKQTGKALTYDCWNATDGNVGCGVQGLSASSGPEFNAQGGGVYAVELRVEGIRVWLFDRHAIPQDVRDGNPDPILWGTALADFPRTECEVEKYFRDLSIVVNISLCGDWAGSVFGKQKDGCDATGLSCEDFVRDFPEMFGQAYWEFGGFRVYQAKR
ncbi:unnamed protein product [Periconia digitata]|uniref:endo-1,3(4)-beta-glucanase n=1 Tax=Periconia digitata TaxID=1303443 RepID=A0A9W4XHI5_9PLEO|nr:unnamed protein product [Periconia digitata]